MGQNNQIKVQEKLVESNSDTMVWKEKFETLERDSSPASKEYLKNLVLQYLAVSDKSKKLSMQTALMTILELTNEDIKLVFFIRDNRMGNSGRPFQRY